MIEFLLDLLEFSLELQVFILGDVVGNLEVTELVLQILFMHFDEEIHLWITWVLLCAEDHFSAEFLSFYLVNCLTLVSNCELGVTME